MLLFNIEFLALKYWNYFPSMKTKLKKKNVRGMFSKIFSNCQALTRASIVGILNAIGTALEALVIIDFVRI